MFTISQIIYSVAMQQKAVAILSLRSTCFQPTNRHRQPFILSPWDKSSTNEELTWWVR